MLAAPRLREAEFPYANDQFEIFFVAFRQRLVRRMEAHDEHAVVDVLDFAVHGWRLGTPIGQRVSHVLDELIESYAKRRILPSPRLVACSAVSEVRTQPFDASEMWSPGTLVLSAPVPVSVMTCLACIHDPVPDIRECIEILSLGRLQRKHPCIDETLRRFHPDL